MREPKISTINSAGIDHIAYIDIHFTINPVNGGIPANDNNINEIIITCIEFVEYEFNVSEIYKIFDL